MAASPALIFLAGAAMLACTDKGGDGDSDAPVNHTPVADAGADVSGDGSTRVGLDGTRSYDPDGDPIVWHWSFDTVPAASHLDEAEAAFLHNDSADGSTTSFLPDAAGIYVIQLVVEDASGATSAPDFVIVTIEGGEVPVAHAGPDQTGGIGDEIKLDGSASYDPLGRDLTYHWTLVSKPDASRVDTLAGSSTATPQFVADAGGVFIAALTVNNGFHDSPADTVSVFISTGDPAAPTAIAGDDITDAQDCMNLTVDGSASFDPNGDPLEYLWSLQTKPEGSATDNYSFADRTAAVTTFYPDISGTYEFSLAVNDGTEWSEPDIVQAVVSERWANTEPQVEAGDDIEVNAGNAYCSEAPYSTWECGTCRPVTVAVGGDASIVDMEGDPYVIQWSALEGDIEFTGPTDELTTSVYLQGAQPTEPGACETTDYVLWLGATDCPQDEGGDTLVIKVKCCGELYSTDSGR